MHGGQIQARRPRSRQKVSVLPWPHPEWVVFHFYDFQLSFQSQWLNGTSVLLAIWFYVKYFSSVYIKFNWGQYSGSARDVLSVEGLRRIFSYRWSPDRGCYDPGSHRRTTSDSYRPPVERWGPTWDQQFRHTGMPEEGFERDGMASGRIQPTRAEVEDVDGVTSEALQPIYPTPSGIHCRIVFIPIYCDWWY